VVTKQRVGDVHGGRRRKGAARIFQQKSWSSIYGSH